MTFCGQIHYRIGSKSRNCLGSRCNETALNALKSYSSANESNRYIKIEYKGSSSARSCNGRNSCSIEIESHCGSLNNNCCQCPNDANTKQVRKTIGTRDAYCSIARLAERRSSSKLNRLRGRANESHNWGHKFCAYYLICKN